MKNKTSMQAVNLKSMESLTSAKCLFSMRSASVACTRPSSLSVVANNAKENRAPETGIAEGYCALTKGLHRRGTAARRTAPDSSRGGATALKEITAAVREAGQGEVCKRLVVDV